MVRCLFFVLSAVMLFCFSCSKTETEELRQSLEQKDAEIKRLSAEATKNELLFRQASYKLKEANKKAETAGSELEKIQTELVEMRAKAAISESALTQARDELAKRLENQKKELQKTRKELKSSNEDNRKLMKSLEAEKEKSHKAGPWLRSIPAQYRKILKEVNITEETELSEFFKALAMLMVNKDVKIQDLRLSTEFLHEKYNQLMTLKQKHESAFEKMKKDGIDTDKYLKADK